jgi:hypothetical protein
MRTVSFCNHLRRCGHHGWPSSIRGGAFNNQNRLNWKDDDLQSRVKLKLG